MAVMTLVFVVTSTPAQASTRIIGIFYDGSGLSGPSFSVVGDQCNGGGLNIPVSWNDRISSLYTGCNATVLYENTNYSGATFTCFGSGTGCAVTGFMNNRASSIRFF